MEEAKKILAKHNRTASPHLSSRTIKQVCVRTSSPRVTRTDFHCPVSSVKSEDGKVPRGQPGLCKVARILVKSFRFSYLPTYLDLDHGRFL